VVIKNQSPEGVFAPSLSKSMSCLMHSLSNTIFCAQIVRSKYLLYARAMDVQMYPRR